MTEINIKNLNFFIDQDRDIEYFPSDINFNNGAYKVNMFGYHTLYVVLESKTIIGRIVVNSEIDPTILFKIKMQSDRYTLEKLSDTNFQDNSVNTKYSIFYSLILTYLHSSGKGTLYGRDSYKLFGRTKFQSQLTYQINREFLFEKYGFMYKEAVDKLNDLESKIDCDKFFKDWDKINLFQTTADNETLRRSFNSVFLGDRGSFNINKKGRPYCVKN
jgi:hypothetical protein